MGMFCACEAFVVAVVGLVGTASAGTNSNCIRIGDVGSFGFGSNLNANYDSASGGDVVAVGNDDRLPGG